MTDSALTAVSVRLGPTPERRWHRTARREQLPPDGDWRVWLFMGGRGTGKPPCGREWLISEAMSRPNTDWVILGATFGACRDVCLEGESGILRVAQPGEVVHYTRESWRGETEQRLEAVRAALSMNTTASGASTCPGPGWMRLRCSPTARTLSLARSCPPYATIRPRWSSPPLRGRWGCSRASWHALTAAWSQAGGPRSTTASTSALTALAEVASGPRCK